MKVIGVIPGPTPHAGDKLVQGGLDPEIAYMLAHAMNDNPPVTDNFEWFYIAVPDKQILLKVEQ